MSTKTKASEIYGKLLPTIGESAARAFCDEKIAKGEYEADLGTPPIITQEELTSILELVKGSTQFKTPEPALKQGLRQLNKGQTRQVVSDSETSLEVSELVAAVESLSEQEDTRYNQLAKGITAVSTISQRLLTTLVEMDRRNTQQARVIEDLSKVVDGLAKGGPRSVTAGVAAAPHPGELSAATARARAIENGEIPASDNADEKLYDDVLNFTSSELAKGTVQNERRQELYFAQAQLLSGLHPSEVARLINFKAA